MAWSSLGALALLGAFHGINPGMGWLFAVALGMQENRAGAVWRALLPLGLGHACAVAVAILLVTTAGAIVPTSTLRWPIAAALVGLGIRRLLRHRHPRWGGSMRIGVGALTIWSFLVATAHGAGLMVLPIWVHVHDAAGGHAAHIPAAAGIGLGLTATAVHSISYLLVTTAVAWLVFARLGVALLRTSWINLDAIWAASLIITGAFMVAIG